MCIRDRGKENSRNFLLENPKIAAEIEQKIMLKLGIGAEAKAAQTKAAADAIVAEAEQVKAAGAKASGPVLAVPTADEPGLPPAVGE